jgi:hypothetical protein
MDHEAPITSPRSKERCFRFGIGFGPSEGIGKTQKSSFLLPAVKSLYWLSYLGSSLVLRPYPINTKLKISVVFNLTHDKWIWHLQRHAAVIGRAANVTYYFWHHRSGYLHVVPHATRLSTAQCYSFHALGRQCQLLLSTKSNKMWSVCYAGCW